MILRHLNAPTGTPAEASSDVRSASEVFIESQKDVQPPFGIVLQIAHSELAGELARKLSPAAFGDLPPEVVEAAWKHDFGWDESDARQTSAMPATPPKPFPAVPDDELPSWRRSLQLAETYAPLTRVLIGRHFEALSNRPAPRHGEFLATDIRRIREVERTLGLNEVDLKRWAGAVGFCDLLSLYLASGVRESVRFPLTHPAYPDAQEARQVTLSWKGDQPTFSDTVLQPGTHISIEALRFDAQSGEVHPLPLRWSF